MVKKRRSYRGIARKAYRRSRSSGFLGKFGMKGGLMNSLVGAGALVVAQRYQPFGGQYKPAVDKILLGVALPMVGMDNRDFLSVGIKEGIATLANSYLGGGATVPTNGGSL